jgi:lipopolysaccharide export system ATP-binding protein
MIETATAPPRETSGPAETRKLWTTSLRKVYRGRAVVQDVSIEVGPGEIVGLLGPNGAGKTTTFYMVVGLTPPDSGTVQLGDEDITELPMYLRAQRGISYLPQEPSVFRRMSVEDNLRAIFETLDLSHAEQERRIDQLIADLGLSKVRRTRGALLSGGERRRVEIARALVISPWYILLDEPFAGIDPIAVTDIQKIIAHLRDRGIGVLITDHNVRETLKITDRAYIVHDGVIFKSGTPQSLAEDEDVKRIYLGADFRLD